MLRAFLLASVVVAAPLALGTSLLAACGSGDVALGSQADSQGDGEGEGEGGGHGASGAVSSCQAAGGTCHLGGFSCASHASATVDDCNPDRNPGGAFCCLDPDDSGASPDGGMQLAACTLPSTVEPLDASSTSECSAARELLICQGTTNVGTNNSDEICLSDDPTACPDGDGEPDASFTCSDECADDEYGAACGFGPGAAPEPPASCRTMGTSPGGTTYYCCPCGS